MRCESVALAFFAQALQAGLKERLAQPSQPAIEADIHTESLCRCVCHCSRDSGDYWWLPFFVAGLGVGGSATCLCRRRIEPAVSSPNHRRRGHGIISEPAAWHDPRRLLR